MQRNRIAASMIAVALAVVPASTASAQGAEAAAGHFSKKKCNRELKKLLKHSQTGAGKVKFDRSVAKLRKHGCTFTN